MVLTEHVSPGAVADTAREEERARCPPQAQGAALGLIFDKPAGGWWPLKTGGRTTTRR